MRVNDEGLIITYYVNMAVRHAVFEEPETRRRGGGPRPMTVAERIAHFWSQVKRDSDGCWEWQAATFHNGYGMFAAGRKNGKAVVRHAHRIAYELTHGLTPRGLVVMHTCDNPKCCNPSHLRAGTQADNLRDAVAKGRRRGRRPLT